MYAAINDLSLFIDRRIVTTIIRNVVGSLVVNAIVIFGSGRDTMLCSDVGHIENPDGGVNNAEDEFWIRI